MFEYTWRGEKVALYPFQLVLIEPPADLFTSPATTNSGCIQEILWITYAAEPTHDNNRFLLHIVVQSGPQRVIAKVPFPQFLLHHGRDNPYYVSSLVVV